MYWKGALPYPVVEAVSRYDGPINVEVHEDARYASTELEPRADRLVNEPELALAAGIDLVRVGWPQNGTGVTAGVLATEPPPDLASAEAFLTHELAVPVDLTIEEPYETAGRQDDAPPWYAGGRTKVEIRKDTFKNCSTGWGVKVGQDEKVHVLTAAHCGAAGDKVHNGDRSRQLGTLADRSTDLDSAIIDVTSAAAKMFTGRPTANTSLVMEKAVEVKVGAWICGSGASTGQNCDIKIDAVNERIETEIGWVRTTTSVHKDAGGIAGGKGDSGGPVYIPVEKETKVQAVGIIVAVRSEVDCRRDDDTGTCHRRMAFVPVDPLLKHWKATLITG